MTIHFTAYAPTITLERETRTIRGEITSFGVPTSDYRQIVLEAGSLKPRMPLKRVKMLVDHDQRQPVGFMVELADDNRTAAFSIPAGDAGDKALADAANGLRDGLSVGINVLMNADGRPDATYDDDTGTLTVHAAELVEVSLCAIPAYQDAGVTSVAASREAPSTTSPTPKENTEMTATLTRADLDAALSASAEESERTLDARLAAFGGTPKSTGPTWATYGAYVKDLAAGSSEAMSFYAETLAYDGPTSADTSPRNTWIADAIKLVDKGRPITNTFTREPLPKEGMTLEYLELATNTMQVAEQVKEGDDLVRGKITLRPESVPVKTYGGYTELPKQVIDRANPAYVNTAFRAMQLEYARATEAAVVAALKSAITAQRTANNTVTLASAPTAFDWLDILVDASEKYADNGYSLDGTLVSKDVFKDLLRLEDSAGNMLMRVFGEGMNQTGTVDLTGLKGNLASVTFKLLPTAAAGTAAFYSEEALTVWESAGAPFQLQDQNILNLTEAFSQYGYLAVASQFKNALVPVVFSAAG